jgi:hypothetical protein
MSRRPDWMLSRHRTVRHFASDWTNMELPGNYAAWLVRNGGPRMRRALIKARQRYEKQKPRNIRASAIHRAYSRKRRGWKPVAS